MEILKGNLEISRDHESNVVTVKRTGNYILPKYMLLAFKDILKANGRNIVHLLDGDNKSIEHEDVCHDSKNPLKSKEYSAKLKDPRWQKKRLTIMSRDDWKCQYCGNDKAQLAVHHMYYDAKLEPWEYHDDSLITLCNSCHVKEHNVEGKLKSLVDKFLTCEMSLLGLDLIHFFNEMLDVFDLGYSGDKITVKKQRRLFNYLIDGFSGVGIGNVLMAIRTILDSVERDGFDYKRKNLNEFFVNPQVAQENEFKFFINSF